ncbi:MAG: amino acid adenylation domain-containing protein [Methylococcus sp.]|nr:amino acid adenylation domain-containing protein [Methylococcus sp.]
MLNKDQDLNPQFGWNDTAVKYPGNQCLNLLFDEQAARTPDATAISCGSLDISYRELGARTDRLAAYLKKLGVGTETLVGICLDRTPDLIVGLLGILKAGGAYVPLDPEYPADRLAYMLEDTQAPVLIGKNSMRTRLPEFTGHFVCLESDRDLIEAEGIPPVSAPADGGRLAYIIYTSGSTGKPKGVMIEHRGICNLLHWAQSVFDPDDLRSMLASTSICFDLSAFEIFLPLICGGRIVLVENALALLSLPPNANISFVNTVPSAIKAVINNVALPPSVRVVALAGEPLKPALVDQIYQRGNVQRVFDLYGPSETTTYSSFSHRPRHGLETIGRPIANTEIYILALSLAPVPAGVAGEIFVGGAGLARGYLGQPEITAEKFIAHPFSGDPDARLYRTGDSAEYLPDGRIKYLGRLDHQVKIRGYRIEPGEIETVLLKHPDIQEALVTALETSPGEKRLVAYVVMRSTAPEPAQSQLQDHLRNWLPEHMIPSAFVRLEHFPLTPNGKIDRKQLPEPSTIHATALSDRPKTDTEKKAAALWETLLKVQDIGLQEDFFQLGGSSLLAVEMLGELQKLSGKTLSLHSLFPHATVKSVAMALDLNSDTTAGSLIPMQPHGELPALFLVPGVGGYPIMYRDLVPLLEARRPIYGIQVMGCNELLTENLEVLAARFASEILQLRPQGPYHLAGYSAGACLAFEIAQQLKRQGAAIGHLVMLDGEAPGYPQPAPFWRRWGTVLATLAALPPYSGTHPWRQAVRAEAAVLRMRLNEFESGIVPRERPTMADVHTAMFASDEDGRLEPLSFLRRLGMHWALLASYDHPGRLDYLGKLFRNQWIRFQGWGELSRDWSLKTARTLLDRIESAYTDRNPPASAEPADTGPAISSAAAAALYYENIFRSAALKYMAREPLLYDGDMTVIKSRWRPGVDGPVWVELADHEKTLGWSRWVRGKIHRHRLPCSHAHADLFGGKNLQAMAEILNAALDGTPRSSSLRITGL